MELLAQLGLDDICAFFLTFFKLPNKAWHGFMASTLSSVELLGFASLMFILAPASIKIRLMGHIFVGKSVSFIQNNLLSFHPTAEEHPNSFGDFCQISFECVGFADESGLYLFGSYIGQSEAQRLQMTRVTDVSQVPNLNA